MPTPSSVEILAVFPPKPTDNTTILGSVSFAYEHSGFNPLTITRSYKLDGEDEYRNAVVAKVSQGKVGIQRARILSGKNGPWLTGDFNGCPREVMDEVVSRALDELDRRKGEAVSS